MPPFKELIREKVVIGALGVVGIIFIGSAAYYLIESHPPTVSASAIAATVNASTTDIIANGTVTPVQNPNLSFQTAGQVQFVHAVVGQQVAAGTVLASLDTGILSANYAAAQANLAGLQAGPRNVDVAGKETAVQSAQATLSDEYAKLPSVLTADAGQAEEAVHSTDTLFGLSGFVDYPHTTFISNDQNAEDLSGQERGDLVTNLQNWDTALTALSASSSPATIDVALDDAISRLTTISTFFSTLSDAANNAVEPLPPTELGAVSAGRSTVNGLIVSLNAEKQTLANEELGVTSAQNALALTQAGATSQAIQAAQAQVDAASAALTQAEIVAPFSGTVASVAIKEGDPVSPNAPAIALLPNGAFEVDVYLSEIDVTRIAVGQLADVTLDAYGAQTIFPASVASVDSAPTMVNGVPSYKATLIFAQTDPRITAGMTANAVIHTTAPVTMTAASTSPSL